MEQNPNCTNCSSKNTIKKGIRKNKLQTIQKYKCKNCNRIFTPKELKHKSYPTNIILNALSYYNLGYTLEKTSNLINQRYKTNTTAKTIQLWINEFKDIPYSKIRKQALNLYSPKNIIFKKPLQHQQIYLFQYHKAKLYLLFHNIKYNNQFTNLSKFYEPIKAYLEKIPTAKFPHHIFKSYETKLKEGIIRQSPEAEIAKNSLIKNSTKNNNSTSVSGQNTTALQSPKAKVAKLNNINNKNISEQRASQLAFSTLPIIKKEKQNQANKLAKLALETASSKSKAHESIEKFFLINDSTTIATEMPVYLTKDDIKYFKDRKFKISLENYATPITGHIDILQIRNGLTHILDFKPEADSINPVEQLTIYALALASRTKLALRDFKCAWFDENYYYEFFPLHAVFEKQKV